MKTKPYVWSTCHNVDMYVTMFKMFAEICLLYFYIINKKIVYIICVPLIIGRICLGKTL